MFNGIHTPPTVKNIISIIKKIQVLMFMIVCRVAYWLFYSLIFSKIFGSMFDNNKEFVEFWTWLARMSELCRCVMYSLPLWCVCVPLNKVAKFLYIYKYVPIIQKKTLVTLLVNFPFNQSWTMLPNFWIIAIYV